MLHGLYKTTENLCTIICKRKDYAFPGGNIYITYIIIIYILLTLESSVSSLYGGMEQCVKKTKPLKWYPENYWILSSYKQSYLAYIKQASGEYKENTGYFRLHK
jgi:hypothetical protein